VLAYLTMSGFTTGCIYALVALSIVLLFRTTSIVNFSHGEQVMFGGYVLYLMVVVRASNYAVATITVVAATIVVGLVTYVLTYRRLYRQGLMAVFLGTLGLGYILRGVARYFFGGQGDYLAVPPALPTSPISVLDISVLPQQLLALGATLVVMIVLAVMMNRTTLGLWMAATAENERAAKLVGIPVELVHLITFALSAAISGLAAVLIVPLTLLYPDMGFLLFVKGFAAAVLGGLKSFPGAVVGGLLIGLIEQFGAAYVFTGLQDVSAFFVLMAALIFFPNGLFSSAKLRRI
jgi:branched-chain amino acid transport system permease protein